MLVVPINTSVVDIRLGMTEDVGEKRGMSKENNVTVAQVQAQGRAVQRHPLLETRTQCHRIEQTQHKPLFMFFLGLSLGTTDVYKPLSPLWTAVVEELSKDNSRIHSCFSHADNVILVRTYFSISHHVLHPSFSVA